MNTLFFGVCIDIYKEVEEKKIQWEKTTEKDIIDKYGNSRYMEVRLYKENFTRQCDAFIKKLKEECVNDKCGREDMEWSTVEENALRIVLNGMLYIGWNISDHALTGFGSQQMSQYIQIMKREMKVFMLPGNLK
jgi:hypothetical protein